MTIGSRPPFTSGDSRDVAPAGAGAQRFAAHLQTEYAAVFAYFWAPEVDATNWRAEQAVRPAVVARKVCGGKRTACGAETQQILATVVRTANQRTIDLTELFTTLLQRSSRSFRWPSNAAPSRFTR